MTNEDEFEVAVRPGTARDLEALVGLQLQLAEHHRSIQPDNPRYQTEPATWKAVLERELASDEVVFYVAERDGALVGFVKLTFVPRPWGLSGQIETLVVDRSRRRLGVGRALIGAAERAAVDRGASAFRLHVLAGNDEAGAFYEHMGYELLALRYGKPAPS